MGYDYTGYGASTGEMPSVGHTLSDITAVFDHLVVVSDACGDPVRLLSVLTCFMV